MSVMVGADLKRWRKSHRWSQQQAAERLGISKRALVNYENGTRRITGPVALACAALSLGLRLGNLPWDN